MITKKTFRSYTAQFVALLLLLLIGACSGNSGSPEDSVRATINAMEVATEERSLSRFMQHVSEHYSDHEGHNKKAIARYVQLNYLRNQSINIFSVIQSIEIIDNTALVEVSVAMSGREADLSKEANRLRADTLHFSVLFQREDDDYLVKSVSWDKGWR